MSQLLNIIYEDAQLLVLNKPAGLVCHPTKEHASSSLIGRVRLHLGPAVRPYLINRLDRETSGLVIVGKEAASARELRKLWEGREVEKIYLAIVLGHVARERGVVSAPLGPDQTSRIAIKNCVRPDGAPAETKFELVRTFCLPEGNFSLLRIQLLTGRKHQIRIHLAHRGHPIVGDKIYGGDEDLYLAFVQSRLSEAQRAKLILPHHALHAGRLRFTWRGRQWNFSAGPEPWFADFVSNHEIRETHEI